MKFSQVIFLFAAVAMGHHGVEGRLNGHEGSAVSTGDVTTINSNIENNEEDDEQQRRQLRHNCSWNYSTTTDYRICKSSDFTKCLKMTSTTNTELATYTSGDDKFHWKVIEVTVGGKQRVRLQNQSFNHNLAAEDIDGNDGATAFKISEGSSPCDTSATVKISYLDPSGTPSNDWLKATSGNSLVWKAKSGQGTTFRVLTA